MGVKAKSNAAAKRAAKAAKAAAKKCNKEAKRSLNARTERALQAAVFARLDKDQKKKKIAGEPEMTLEQRILALLEEQDESGASSQKDINKHNTETYKKWVSWYLFVTIYLLA